MQNSSPGWLFLDFDGVVCDSLEECYQSSWLALSGSEISELPPAPPPFDADYRARFVACRPFIRSGEDYVVLHELVSQRRLPNSQQEFDVELKRVGRAALDDMKTRLYQVRERLLQFHRPLWLSWNPLFPGMARTLSTIADHPQACILSTKKAQFIQEILSFHGVDWPLDRILYSGNEKKLDWVAKVSGGRPSVLLDDQIDHLDFAHPTCRCLLAAWGYVASASIGPGTPSVTLEEGLKVLDAWCA